MLTLLVLLPGVVLSADCETLAWESPWPVEQYALENGLRVVLVPQNDASSVFLRIHVNVGAQDEQAGQSGFAHLFEHMMFKGSRGLEDGDYARVIAVNGGSHNAMTDFDSTSYYAEVPPEALGQLLWLEGRRFSAMAIDQLRFNNQIDAVLEEKAMRIDNKPYIKPGANFFIEQLKDTPYGHLLIGTEAELRAATLSAVQDFFDRYYTANNMVLVLAGLFDTKQAKGIIKRYFSRLKPGVVNQRTEFILPQQKKVYRKVIDPLAPFPAYAIAWHTPGKVSSEYRAVEMINKLILGGDDSRLIRKMEIDEKLVFASYSFPATFENLGIANLGFVPRSYTDLNDIKTIVDSELRDIHRHGFSADEVCAAIVSAQSDLLDEYYDNHKLSKRMAERVIRGVSAVDFSDELHRYQAIDRASLNAVAKKYFTDQSMVLEIKPSLGKRILKSVMEVLPKAWSKKIEKKVMQ